VTGTRQILRNCTITGNGHGYVPPSPTVHGDRVKVFDSIVADNEGVGVEGYSVFIRDSAVTYNGQSPACGVTHNCNVDVGSFRKPRIRDTQCEYSFDSRACGGCNGESPFVDVTDRTLHHWGICSLD